MLVQLALRLATLARPSPPEAMASMVKPRYASSERRREGVGAPAAGRDIGPPENAQTGRYCPDCGCWPQGRTSEVTRRADAARGWSLRAPTFLAPIRVRARGAGRRFRAA